MVHLTNRSAADDGDGMEPEAGKNGSRDGKVPRGVESRVGRRRTPGRAWDASF
jgi:hypothetical protein